MFCMETAKSNFLFPLVFLIDATKIRGGLYPIYQSCKWEHAFQFFDSIWKKEGEITFSKLRELLSCSNELYDEGEIKIFGVIELALRLYK